MTERTCSNKGREKNMTTSCKLKYRILLINYQFFFFQAEDGIRDGTVTGVQTCALPISAARPRADRADPRVRFVALVGAPVAQPIGATAQRLSPLPARHRRHQRALSYQLTGSALTKGTGLPE